MKITLLLLLILTSHISQSQTMQLDSIKNADNSIKITFNYTNNVNIGDDLYEIDDDGITWNKIEKIVFNYNSDNKLDTEIYLEWNNSEFINNKKIEYTYNTNLSINTKIYSNWNSTSNDWVISTTEQFNYNAELLNEIINQYNEVGNSNKYSFIYDSNDVLIRTETYDWDDSINDWKNNPWEKTEYSYSNENVITKTGFYDFNLDGVWEMGDSLIEFEYDNNYTKDDLILPNLIYGLIPNESQHMVTNSEGFENSNSNWVSINSFEYFYTDITLSTFETINKRYKIYPNPTSSQVKFKIDNFDKIEVYDINGKKMIVSKSNIIDIKNLSNGIYFYKIYKEKGILTGKLIKK